MAPEFVDLQLRLWGFLGGPQDKNWTSWPGFRSFNGTNENATTAEGLTLAAALGDLEDGPPHPQTMAALAVMARLKKSVTQVEVLEHVEEAMRLCRVGLKALPKKHWRGVL